MTSEELQLESFRMIRRKISDILNPCSNEEIAGYVKGVVDLERQLYGTYTQPTSNLKFKE